MIMKNELILASASPRRQELLKQVDIDYSIRVADVDESVIMTNDPVEKVKQLALLKSKHVPFMHDQELILAADTVVVHANKIFGKPKNKQEARQMIETLSGTTHDVYTGVAICSKREQVVFAEKTVVEFWSLDPAEIEWYIQSNEPNDKAGAYAIQGLGARFVKQISGDYYNVVGLPVSRVVRELRKFSIDNS